MPGLGLVPQGKHRGGWMWLYSALLRFLHVPNRPSVLSVDFFLLSHLTLLSVLSSLLHMWLYIVDVCMCVLFVSVQQYFVSVFSTLVCVQEYDNIMLASN